MKSLLDVNNEGVKSREREFKVDGEDGFVWIVVFLSCCVELVCVGVGGVGDEGKDGSKECVGVHWVLKVNGEREEREEREERGERSLKDDGRQFIEESQSVDWFEENKL